MKDAIQSKSIIQNFMANAGRTTCNEFLYEALQDADEALAEFYETQKVKNELYDMKRKYMKGIRIQHNEETQNAVCPICQCVITFYNNSLCKHCPECGTKLVY